MQRGGPRIFLTYGDEERALDVILDISKVLQDNGFYVCTEHKEARMRNMNVNEWVEDALANDFVLICIDKTYSEYACRHVPTEKSDNERQSTRQYIFNLVQTEIVHEGCLNYKFIPILFGGARHEHLPLVFRSTTAYQWPSGKTDLLNRLLGRSEYSPPSLGPAPTPIFEPV